ncbi:RNA recognition motif (RRM, RBD, or RNP domain) [Novymonas esmeraldas]|uniref:RNA recognition motif (RRM, RBD, or RNP domain) n=1 Tax=Novymonas esmeraldas TaxID=1808958 RepID=A0AAW0F7K6_9TRYP
MKKYRSGNSGVYTPEYHALLGSAPWIIVRRLLSCPLRDLGDDDSSQQLSEGDIATVFSQFGEILDVRFVRHRKTGRFLGTAFVKFKDYRSGILAADGLNSDVDKGENFFLSASPPSSAEGGVQKGISVERCEEAVVPQLCSAEVETYAAWLARHNISL